MTVPRRARRTPPVLVSAVTAALALAVLAGCSSSDSGSGTPAGTSAGSSSAASPSPAPTDGRDLVQSASDALGDADSFHIEGTIVSDGTEVALDVTYGADVAQGTIDAGDGGTVELRKTDDGTVYANGDSDFYATGNDGSGPDYSTVVGKWVVVDDSAPEGLASVAGLLDRDDLVSSLDPDSDEDDQTYDVSGPEDVDGTSAYIVTDKDGSTFAVAAEGDPLPVRITNSSTDGGKGEIAFDGYGDDVQVDAPDDSEIVELPAS